MANKASRGIRLRRRVRIGRGARNMAGPAVPVGHGFRTNALILREFEVKPAAEAGYTLVPITLSTFPEIKSASTNIRAWRVTSVTIGAEPAHATSTQHAGLCLSPSTTTESGTGYGATFKHLRFCHRIKRSPMGGNIQVTWPVNMRWTSVSSQSGLDTPAVVMGVTNPSTITSAAWYEIALRVELIGGI